MSRRLLRAVLAAGWLGSVACAAESAPAARRHVVEISAFQFRPAVLLVAPGDTVVWENHDAVPHSATASSGSWDSGSIAAGGSWSRVVDGEATESYLCIFHPGMTGEISAE